MFGVDTKVQLYFRCGHCQKMWKWPQNRARKFCDRKCQNGSYYKEAKNRRLEEINAKSNE